MVFFSGRPFRETRLGVERAIFGAYNDVPNHAADNSMKLKL